MQLPPASSLANWTLPVASLPQLLTGGDASSATEITLNNQGQIVLTGSSIDATSGSAIASGTIDTSSSVGGNIQVLGNKVGLVSANIDASGTNGGGNILIGGDYQGGGTIPKATRTYVSSDSNIAANSLINGNGGRVIVWSNEVTGFAGNISARGGINSGNGGFAEVSGKGSLIFTGNIDLGANNGNFGQLLLDPLNITIAAGTGTDDSEVVDGQILAGDRPGESLTISEATLEDTLSRADVVLEATNDITIATLADNTLTSFTGAITFTADADNDGVGAFTMNPTDSISTFFTNVTISGASVTTGNILTDGGNINLTSSGAISTGNLVSAPSGEFGSIAGDITLNAGGNITTALVDASNEIFTEGNADGGNIDFIAGSNITTGEILSFADTVGNGGTVSLNAGGNIATSNVDSSGVNADGGAVNFTAGGTITSAAINSGAGGTFGNGGNITLNAGNNISADALISDTGNIDEFLATGDIELVQATFGNGGNVSLTSSNGSIAVNNAIVTGSLAGSGGAVTLDANNVTFNSIVTSGLDLTGGQATAAGGSVQIFADRVVRGTGTLPTIPANDFINIPANTTIFTQGDTQGGAVSIQHDGDITNNPFIVGDATITATNGNGTLGAINTGTQVITSQSFPNPGSVTQGNVTINFINTPPTLSANTSLTGAQQNQPFTFTFADLAAVVADANSDITTIVVDAIAPGATLTINGFVATPGAAIAATDSLVFTPPVDATGNINAFSIRASDRVSSSTPVQIAVNVTPTPSPSPTPSPTPTPIPSPTPSPIPIPSPSPSPDSTVLIKPQPPERSPVTPQNPRLTSNPLINALPPEVEFTNQFESYLGIPSSSSIASPDDEREIAQKIAEETGVKPAFVYVSFVPPEIESEIGLQKQNKLATQDKDQLELVVVTAKGNPIRRRIPTATRKQVLATATKLRNEVTNTRRLRGTTYLKPAQQMYNWLVAPIASDLQAREIGNLVFLLDAGLRSMPIAAMHDGKGFLVEKYSVGLMPSISLTDTRYVDIKNSQVLAMGISESTQGQVALPAVTFELTTLVNRLWSGSKYINQAFTKENLKAVRRQRPFSIIHMATHADIESGGLDNSYIQLWNDRLRLNQIRQLELNDPQVEMLVLSACRTALGNEQAELGFAGLAVNAGVKTTVASLWFVNDAATAAFMTQFYRYLNTAPIKADALREAQVAMAKGKVYIKDGQLQGLGSVKGLPLPPGSVNLPNQNFAHPYFWSGFTMVGNPW